MRGEPLPDYVPVWDVRKIHTLTADGNLKCGRFCNVGRSYDGIPPTEQCFFGRANDRFWPGLRGSGGPAVRDVEAVPVNLDCPHPRLTYERVSRKAGGGVLDVWGVWGGVCGHGFPVEGAFIAMDGPENFSLGCEMLGDVLSDTQVLNYYQDTACSFGKHFSKWWGTHRGEGDSDAPGMAVGWFHAEAHRLLCCLNWSGLYLEGAHLPLARRFCAACLRCRCRRRCSARPKAAPF